jgi:hypothetical protein
LFVQGSLGHIGKNKKKKLEKQLRQKLIESGTIPSTSAMNDDNTDDDFEMPKKIELASGPPVRLDEAPNSLSVYNSSKCDGYDEALLHSPLHWHLILVKSFILRGYSE